MKSERKQKTIEIKDHEVKGQKHFREINFFINENTKIKINLNKIMNLLQVKLISEIIQIYNNKKYWEQSLYTQFQNLNKEINFLNAQLHEYLKDINEIEAYISDKLADTQTTEPNGDVGSSQFDCELDKIRKENLLLFEQLRLKEDVVNLVCKKVLLNDEKLNCVLLTMQKTFLKKLGLYLDNFNFKRKRRKSLESLGLISLTADELPFGFFRSVDAKSNLLNGAAAAKQRTERMDLSWNLVAGNIGNNGNTSIYGNASAIGVGYNVNELEKSYLKFFDYSKDLVKNKSSGN